VMRHQRRVRCRRGNRDVRGRHAQRPAVGRDGGHPQLHPVLGHTVSAVIIAVWRCSASNDIGWGADPAWPVHRDQPCWRATWITPMILARRLTLKPGRGGRRAADLGLDVGDRRPALAVLCWWWSRSPATRSSRCTRSGEFLGG
jgi:hypothetical protein